MSDVVAALLRDHANIGRVLEALERQLAVFDEAGRPDYDVLQGIIDYFETYPEQGHHPVEDALFRRLGSRDPAAAESFFVSTP